MSDSKTRLPCHMLSWRPGWCLELGVEEQAGPFLLMENSRDQSEPEKKYKGKMLIPSLFLA